MKPTWKLIGISCVLALVLGLLTVGPADARPKIYNDGPGGGAPFTAEGAGDQTAWGWSWGWAWVKSLFGASDSRPTIDPGGRQGQDFKPKSPGVDDDGGEEGEPGPTMDPGG